MAKAIINGQTIFGNVALGQGGSNMHDYSTDEQVVGTWIDGSTVYEKTIEIGNLTKDSSWHDVAHGVSNLDKIISIGGMYQDNANGAWIPLPTAYRPGNNIGVQCTADTTTVKYFNNWTDSAVNAVVTIRYTKTA